MSVFVCGPPGIITIDLLFVSDQLGTSGPLVRSIISAHYHAHAVTEQRGNEPLPFPSLFAKMGGRKMSHDCFINQCY